MNNILNENNIVLKADLSSKEEAIRFTGQILNDRGYVTPEYIDAMLEREKLTSTYMGNNVAIPHGTEDAKKAVQKTGLSIVTVPDGVDFGADEPVKLLIGIAGIGDEHLELLSKIAIVCSEAENVEKIVAAENKSDIITIFEEVEA